MVRSSRFWCLAAWVLVTSACGSPDAPPGASPDAGGSVVDAGTISAEEQARIDTAQAWVDQVVAYDWAPGIAVAIVRADGQHFISAGTLAWNSSVPVDEHTIFELGSISKTFTATTLAQLIEDGTVQLSTPAETLLPSGATFPAGPDGEKVTLQHLATHHSGLPTEALALWTGDPAQPYGNTTEAELFEALSKVSLTSTPGTRFTYSNLGMGVLGHLTARAAGTGSFEELLYGRVLVPLGMNRTYVSPVTDPNAAMGHSEEGPVPPIQFSVLHGAGAVTSTASDMSTWLRAQLHAMAGRDDALPPGMGPALRLTHHAHATTGVPGLDLGLAWFRAFTDPDELPNAGELVQHGGLTFGFKTMSVASAEDDLGVVVLTNSTTLPEEKLTASLLRLWRGEQVSFELRPSIDLPVETLEKYVGVYRMSTTFTLTVTRDEDRLFIQGTGQPRLRVYAHEENAFHSRAVEAEFVFHADTTGKITGLTLHQGGGEFQATREE